MKIIHTILLQPFQQNMSSSLKKSFSAELKRKPNSHTKLPNLSNTPKLRTQFIQPQKKNKLQPITQIDLMTKRTSSLQVNSSQLNNKGNSKIDAKLLLNNKITINPKDPFNKDASLIHSVNVIPEATDLSDKGSQYNSSKGLNSPIGSIIVQLLPPDFHKCVHLAKQNQQKLMGRVSALWWGVTDTIFLSLQKMLKIKRFVEEGKNSEAETKKVDKNKKIQNKKSQIIKQERKDRRQNKKGDQITVESNIKGSIEFAKIYSYLEYESIENEKGTLVCYEDPNHVMLILEAYFYEKCVIYLLGSIRKWFHPEEKLLIHTFSIEALPCIIECRKLILDILFQAIQNEQQDNKIRKPKYIARQKKLIQISKFTSLLKTQLEKCLNLLGSTHRYGIFSFSGVKEHKNLIQVEEKLRYIIFDTPRRPYVSENKKNKKEFLLIIEPLNLLYRYNKKDETIQIDPYAESFLIHMSTIFEIIFFTASDKDDSLLNFLGVLDRVQILATLDKHYVSYKKGKTVKNIEKIEAGYSLEKVLVIDERVNGKYYQQSHAAVYLTEGYHAQTKLARVGGKLVRLQDYDENHLRILGNKIYECAEKGGHWHRIVSQSHKK